MHCKDAMEIIKQNSREISIDFDSLIYSLNLLDVKLLKLFYVPRSTCWTLDNVVKQLKLKGMEVSKETVRRYLLKLDRLGLLKVIRKSKPLAIQSNHQLESEVKKLIALCTVRLTL